LPQRYLIFANGNSAFELSAGIAGMSKRQALAKR